MNNKASKISRTALAITTCAIFLIGCGKDETLLSDLESLREHLQHALDINIPPPIVDRSDIAYPRRRELSIRYPRTSISFSEFFQISGCQLNRLVGEHNSTLSKNHGYSENMFYDIEFITLAEQCLNAINEDSTSSFNDKLSSIIKTKKSRLSSTIFNAVFASKEVASFFSVYNAYPDKMELSTATHLVTLLDIIASTDKNPPKEARAHFDITLGKLAQEKMGGKSLLGIHTLSLYLKTLNPLLSNYLNKTCDGLEHQKGVNVREEIERLLHIAAQLEIRATEIQQLKPLIPQQSHTKTPALHQYWYRHWNQNNDSAKSTYSLFIEQLTELKSMRDKDVSRQTCEW